MKKMFGAAWMMGILVWMLVGCAEWQNLDAPAPPPLPPTEVELTGNVLPDRVELMWLIKGWPEKVDGFLIKRRHRDAFEWRQLSPVPIYPELNRNKNWAMLGLNDEQINACLVLWDDKTSVAKRDSRMTNEQLLKRLRVYGVSIGDRLAMRADYRNALLFSFGYIDNNPEPDCEYALFGVDAKGRESREPLAVFDGVERDETQYRVRDFSAEVRYAAVVLCFSFPEADYERLDLEGFRVYRRTRADGNWEVIQHQLPAPDPKNGVFYFEVLGSNNARHDADFAVAALAPFELETGRVELHWPGTN